MSFHGSLEGAGGEHDLGITIRDGRLRGTRDGEDLGELAVSRRGGALVLAGPDGARRAVVAVEDERVLVHWAGRVHEFARAGAAARGPGGGKRQHAGDEPWVASPMTGTLMEVAVAPGDAVAKGGTLAVVEAMKMQFVIKAPRDVVVSAVKVAAGEAVDIGRVLVEFEEPGGDE